MNKNNQIIKLILLIMISVLLSRCGGARKSDHSSEEESKRMQDSITTNEDAQRTADSMAEVAESLRMLDSISALPKKIIEKNTTSANIVFPDIPSPSLVLKEVFPEFPLPPPEPSALEDLTERFLHIVSKLNDVNRILISALNKNGYSRKSYFHVPNGFALVTQLEHINENGYSVPEPDRWTTESTSKARGEFDLKYYIYSLLNAKPGYYRCIAFIITNDYYTYSPKPPTKKEIDNWLIQGFNKLPLNIGEINFTDDYTVNALIYEFKKRENEENVSIIIPASISGKNHLINSGIFNSISI